MSAGPFTWKWIQKNLDLPRPSDKRPGRPGCEKIAAAFNHAFAREVSVAVYDSPHIFWATGARATATVHPDPESSKNERRWSRHVRAMGDAVWGELHDANPNRKPPFGYTRTGPVAKLLELAIPLITQEDPPAGAVSQELVRQRQRRTS
jgi:hypothetical protein